MKKISVVVTLLVALSMVLAITAPVPGVFAGFSGSPVNSQTAGVQQQEDSVDAFVPHRLSELNRVLGISIDYLKTLSSDEITNLYVQNAEALGATVYKAVLDESTGEYSLRLTAGGNVIKAQESSLTTEPKSDYSVYLPMIALLSGYITGETVIDVGLTYAKDFVDTLFGDSFPYGVYPIGIVKSYPSMPISIRSETDPNGLYGALFLGDYRKPFLTKKPVAIITNAVVGSNYTYTNVSFDTGTDFNYGQPYLWADTVYLNPGNTFYQITKKSWDLSDPSAWDLYLGDDLVWANLAAIPDNESIQVEKTPGQKYASSRFNIQGVIPPAIGLYEKYTDPWKVSRLNNALDHYGVSGYPDPFSVLYGMESDEPDDFMFKAEAYPQCYFYNNGVNSTIVRGYAPYRYGYESEECGVGNLEAKRQNDLYLMLQAIHILNKYDRANFDYLDPRYVLPKTTSPLSIANEVGEKWNGYGISPEGPASSITDALLTDVYAVLVTRIGYEYRYPWYKGRADAAIQVLIDTQWGVQNSAPSGMFKTADNGILYRPVNTGGQPLMWYFDSGEGYVLPSANVLNSLDINGMPPEIVDQGVDSMRTLAYMAALLEYKCDKFEHCR